MRKYKGKLHRGHAPAFQMTITLLIRKQAGNLSPDPTACFRYGDAAGALRAPAMNQKPIMPSHIQTHNKQTRLQTTLIYQQRRFKTTLSRKTWICHEEQGHISPPEQLEAEDSRGQGRGLPQRERPFSRPRIPTESAQFRARFLRGRLPAFRPVAGLTTPGCSASHLRAGGLRGCAAPEPRALPALVVSPACRRAAALSPRTLFPADSGCFSASAFPQPGGSQYELHHSR